MINPQARDADLVFEGAGIVAGDEKENLLRLKRGTTGGILLSEPQEIANNELDEDEDDDDLDEFFEEEADSEDEDALTPVREDGHDHWLVRGVKRIKRSIDNLFANENEPNKVEDTKEQRQIDKALKREQKKLAKKGKKKQKKVDQLGNQHNSTHKLAKERRKQQRKAKKEERKRTLAEQRKVKDLRPKRQPDFK